MKLHGYWRSSASYRIRIAIALKGLEFEYIAVNLKIGEQLRDAHRALNSQPFVPILELVDGTSLTQSLAILDYLEEMHPTPSLLPAEPISRARVRAAAQIISADIAPIQNLRVLNFIRAEHRQEESGVNNWAAHWIAEGFRSLEQLVTLQEHRYFLSETPGYFECCLIPQIYNAIRFGVDMGDFPELCRIDARCRNLPAFQSALPENQPDAPKGRT